MPKKNSEPWDFSKSDLYSSPYPGTAVGRTDHLTKRNPLFSESMESHYGKGPKGWKRSDEVIQEEACLLLCQSSVVDASDLDVEVKGGVVYLKGSVPDRYQKGVAEKSIETIDGIQDIMNELTIKEKKQ